MVNCPECDSTNLKFYKGFRGNREEPPEEPEAECQDCGHTFEAVQDEPDEYGDWKFHDQQDEFRRSES